MNFVHIPIPRVVLAPPADPFATGREAEHRRRTVLGNYQRAASSSAVVLGGFPDVDRLQAVGPGTSRCLTGRRGRVV